MFHVARAVAEHLLRCLQVFQRDQRQRSDGAGGRGQRETQVPATHL